MILNNTNLRKQKKLTRKEIIHCLITKNILKEHLLGKPKKKTLGIYYFSVSVVLCSKI